MLFETSVSPYRLSRIHLSQNQLAMTSNNPHEAASDQPPSDDFFEQILGLANFSAPAVTGLPGPDGGLAVAPPPMEASHMAVIGGGGTTGFHSQMFTLGLSLDQGKAGFLKPEDAHGSGIRFRDEVVDNRYSSVKPIFHGQPRPQPVPTASHQPATIRPRVRARRGQATDPHSIAERLRRERIAERIRALHELVPTLNKTDRAAMIDEIVDYVKFLRLQVKVLSMSRLGGAGAVAPLVTDMPLSSSTVEEEGSEGGRTQPAWETWSNDETERQVAKLMEENVGAAMQFLQSKALCIMPVSLAMAIYHSPPPDTPSVVKRESNPAS